MTALRLSAVFVALGTISSFAFAQSEITAVEQMRARLADVRIGTEDEYREIPAIWRVAIDAGKRDNADELRAILDFSLPNPGEPLRDWQAVVIGGGVINGVSQAGPWPAERITQILNGHDSLQRRWENSLNLAEVMADDEAVKPGTRYDALRMIALRPFPEAEPQLRKYLHPDQPRDLQQGSVSGLADAPTPEAALLLHNALPWLSEPLKKFAMEGILKPHEGECLLLQAITAGHLPAKDMNPAIRAALLEHADPAVRSEAERVLGIKEN